MQKKTALIVGATGLTGQSLLALLLEDSHYNRVVILTRKALPQQHSKLEQYTVDFERLEDYQEHMVADDVFCCLGTTIKKAGSKENFKKVDYHYPVNVAEICLKQGAQQFLIVTAIGADAHSNIFYNRVKGEVEATLKKMPYAGMGIFRPSLLLGSRAEKRFGEYAGKLLFKLVGFMMVGKLKRYKGIAASKVAKAMAVEAKHTMQGVHTFESDVLQSYK